MYGNSGCLTTQIWKLLTVKPYIFIRQVYTNTHSGPDFTNARIKIGDTTWAGNVEIHVPSSDWRKHNHTTDEAYKNVILHVVYRDDEPVITPDGQKLPTLELENRISPDLYNRFHSLGLRQSNHYPLWRFNQPCWWNDYSHLAYPGFDWAVRETCRNGD